MNATYRSFMPILTMLGSKRKGETEAQWRHRFDRMQERYGRVLAMRAKLSAARQPPVSVPAAREGR